MITDKENVCIELSKMMKADFAYFGNCDYGIGCDMNFYVLKIIYFSRDKFNPEIDTFIDTYEAKNNEYNPFRNAVVEGNLMDIHNRFINTLNGLSPIIIIDNCKDNDSFNEAINKPTKDGTTMYNINEIYRICMFKGLLPLNKADKVALEIYDLGESFIAKFIIRKPKNILIEEYLHCLKI